MDPHEREAAAAAEGMAETYGRRLPRIGDTVWYWRGEGEPQGRSCGTVVDLLGTLQKDPLIVLGHTAGPEGRKVIKASQLTPCPFTVQGAIQ